MVNVSTILLPVVDSIGGEVGAGKVYFSINLQ